MVTGGGPMYLAGLIDSVLESKKSKLVGRSSYFYICSVLNSAFRNKEPFKFKYELFSNYKKDDYSISGIYDMDEDIKYIILNFSKNCKSLTIDSDSWKDFKFSVSQVCQHESIHQCQWSKVIDPSLKVSSGKLDFRMEQDEDEKEYLSDPDEIDAYAHDIAMEIKFYYPKKDPYKVLSNLSKHKKVWSYNYYKKTFKGEEWNTIKCHLYKKIYKWFPYVTA